MSGRRCVILSQLFYPEEAATGKLLTDLAEAMVAQGMDVEVIAGQPTYFHYGKAPAKLVHKGITVHRPLCTWFRKDSLPGRLLNISTYMFSLLWTVVSRRERGPFLIVTNPPFLPLVGFLAKRMYGAKYVVLVHDVYPDLLPAFGVAGPNSPIVRVWNRINRWIYSHADASVVLGREMARVIAAKDTRPNADQRIRIIPNWADGQIIQPKDKQDSEFFRQAGIQAGFVLEYSGNMGRQHNVGLLIEAMDRLRGEDMHLMFIGGGHKKPTAEKLVAEKGLGNVSFHEFQPYEKVGESLTACDVQVAMLDEAVTGLAVPCKLYGMLASGKALLVVCDERGEMGQVVQEEKCGLVVAPGDLDGLVEAIRWLRDHPQERQEMGRRARKAFEAKYTLEHVAEEYVQAMRSIFSPLLRWSSSASSGTQR